MRTIATFIAVLLALTVAATRVAAAESSGSSSASDTCAQYTRCSECVFEATGVLVTAEHSTACAWCPSTGTCAAAFDNCPNVATYAENPYCEDMQCWGAKNTGNIYLCRVGMGFALFFSILLTLCSAFYYFWMRAVQQAPWKYERLDEAIMALSEAYGGMIGASRQAPKPSTLELEARYHVFLPAENSSLTFRQRAFGATDDERFWNMVGRIAVIPFAVSSIVGAVCTLLLFFTSLAPWYADPFYGIALSAGYVSLLAMAAFVVVFQPSGKDAAAAAKAKEAKEAAAESSSNASRSKAGDSEFDDEGMRFFVDLAILLRGRKIVDVLPIHTSDATNAAPTPAPEKAAPAAAAGGNPLGKADDDDSSIVMTTQAPTYSELDESVAPDLRTKWEEIVRPDEHLLWWESPDRSILSVDVSWLIAYIATGLQVALFLWMLGAIPTKTYPSLLLDKASVHFFALIVFLVFLVMLALTFAGFKRIHILTNQRLIVIAKGIFGSTHVNAADLAAIKHMWASAYQELGHTVVSVHWEVPTLPMRRMPRFSTDTFVGVQKMDEFVSRLEQVARHIVPPPTMGDDRSHLTQVWRVNLFVNIVCALLTPALAIYPKLWPNYLGTMITLITLGFNLSQVVRGQRVMTTYVSPVTVRALSGDANSDSRFSFGKMLTAVAVPKGSSIMHNVRRAATHTHIRGFSAAGDKLGAAAV
jgi:hypothetical protein